LLTEKGEKDYPVFYELQPQEELNETIGELKHSEKMAGFKGRSSHSVAELTKEQLQEASFPVF